MSETTELLRIWQTHLGASRDQCDKPGKVLWDRIERALAEPASTLGLSDAATRWLANGRRGVSSNTMFSKLTGVDALRDWAPDHPHDPDDLDRCLQLLADVPELRERLPRMAKVSRVWAALVARWDEIERSHLDEVGLGWTKARDAEKTYVLMRQVIDSARKRA